MISSPVPGLPEQLVRCEKISQGRYNTVKNGVGKFAIGDTIIAQGKLTKEAGRKDLFGHEAYTRWHVALRQQQNKTTSSACLFHAREHMVCILQGLLTFEELLRRLRCETWGLNPIVLLARSSLCCAGRCFLDDGR